ncbi:heat shock protein 22-like [Phlebotomus argentipes]|uniref:heat shock protein 22-like n=1 Tax=Phlebotomus argentipes TaxID=94469 RepID=UPI0028932E45|nr:heat shock protein 22-like [Phlebotomus argentipes]
MRARICVPEEIVRNCEPVKMAFAQLVSDISSELHRAEPEIRQFLAELSWQDQPGQSGHHGHHHRRGHGCRRRCSRRDFCQEKSCPAKGNPTDYTASLDVKNYASDEINVKTVDNFVVVEGKQEEKEDEFGSISRSFVRRYRIPEEFNIEEASSALSDDGILSIRVPLLATQSKERVIPIQKTGKTHQQPEEAPKEAEAEKLMPEKKDDSSDFEMVKDNMD